MAGTLTRYRGAILGCGLGIASCLMATPSQPAVPHQTELELPETLGSWQLLSREQLHANELTILQASDHWRGIYQCRETKTILVVTRIVGASGPLASHQPEICYAQHDFSTSGKSRIWTVPNQTDRFRFQTLEPRQFEEPAVTIAYAWYDGDRWRAPRVPRLELAGHAALQRLQISMRHPSGMTREIRAAMQQFIQLAVDSNSTNSS